MSRTLFKPSVKRITSPQQPLIQALQRTGCTHVSESNRACLAVKAQKTSDTPRFRVPEHRCMGRAHPRRRTGHPHNCASNAAGAGRAWKLPEQPALLIHTSMRPSCTDASSTRRCTLDGLATSHATPDTQTSGLTCRQQPHDSYYCTRLLHCTATIDSPQDDAHWPYTSVSCAPPSAQSHPSFSHAANTAQYSARHCPCILQSAHGASLS